MPEDEKQEKFYNPAGQVRMPEAADLAQIEATQGQNARVAREGELQRQAETGLTDKERKNVEIMNDVEQKYPDAFTPLVGESGEKGLLQEAKWASGENRWVRLWTQTGVFDLCVPGSAKSEDIKLDTIVELTRDGIANWGELLNGDVRKVPNADIFKDPGRFKTFGVAIMEKDLNRQSTRQELHDDLRKQQAEGEARKQKSAKEKQGTSVDTIKAEL